MFKNKGVIGLVLCILALVGIFYFVKYYYHQQEKEKVDQIRAYYEKIKCYDCYHSWSDSIQKHADEIPEDFTFIKKANDIFFEDKEVKEPNLLKLDSLSQTPEFQKIHPLHKFYTLYYISYGYYKISNYRKTLEYYKKANEYIKEDFNKYSFENQKLQKIMMMISYFFVRNNKALFKNLNSKLEEAIEQEDTTTILNTCYNLAYFNIKSEKLHEYKFEVAPERYNSSLDYVDIAKQYYNKYDYNQWLFVEIEILALIDLLHLRRNKEGLALIHRFDEAYKKGRITDENYRKFQVYALVEMYGFLNRPNIEQEAKDYIADYQAKGGDPYMEFELNKLLARINKDKNNKPAQIEYLQKAYKYCSEKDFVYDDNLSQSLDFAKQLIAIYESQGDMVNTLKWYKNKEKLVQFANDNHQSYLNIMEFFTNREVDYAHLDVENQKKNVKNRNIVIAVFGLFVIALSIALYYINKLFSKNKKYQKRLVNKSRLLHVQNKKISKQNTQMEDLLAQLKETNENLNNFAKVAAHDIKSPLATMHNIIEYLEDKYQEKIDSEDKEMFEFLQTSSMNLNNMINTLLNYSQNKKDLIEYDSVDLNRLLYDTVQKLQKPIVDTSAQLFISDDFPDVRGNQSLLTQLFQNLISNALKFQKPGFTPIIKVKYKNQNEDMLLISVEDNGIGMSKEDQKNIFKIFHRLDSAKDYEGSGIGLATCRKIIKDHGGKIWVESEKGEGTIFFMKLPKYKREDKKAMASAMAS